MPPTVYWMCNDLAWRMTLKHLASYLTIMQWQYESDDTSHEMGRWELHGNISRNGYENAIIGRYGGCFEGGYIVGVMHRRKLRGTREASNGGR